MLCSGLRRAGVLLSFRYSTCAVILLVSFWGPGPWCSRSLLAADVPPTVRMMNATVKLENPKSTATALVVRRVEGSRTSFAILTAAHVFSAAEGDFVTGKFREEVPNGGFRVRPLPLRVRQDGTPVWKSHPSVDLAAIPFEPPADFRADHVDEAELATEEQLTQLELTPGETLYLTGYPHRNEGSPFGHPLMRTLTIATWPLLPLSRTREWQLDGNSHEGDSGGPVFHKPVAGAPGGRDRLMMVAVVTGQRIAVEEHRGALTTMQFKQRLGFAVALPSPLARETLAPVWPTR